MNQRKLTALAGFIVLGMSPSFVDWEQSSGNMKQKTQIIVFYTLGLTLIYYGLLAD